MWASWYLAAGPAQVWVSSKEVGVLICVSPLGAEQEESSKNMKKLDAMTLIKEGGSNTY